MRKITCLIFFILFTIIFSRITYAQTFDFSFDSPIRLEEKLKVNFNISDLSGNTRYRLKVRIGAENNLIAGHTLNSGTDTWVKDWEYWDEFPVYNSDSDGLLSGQITARLTDSYSPGQYKIALAVKEDETESEDESDTKTVDFLGSLFDQEESSVGALPETGINDLTSWIIILGILSIFSGSIILRRQLIN